MGGEIVECYDKNVIELIAMIAVGLIALFRGPAKVMTQNKVISEYKEWVSRVEQGNRRLYRELDEARRELEGYLAKPESWQTDPPNDV